MAYPHTRFRYKVEIEGLDAGGFSEVTGFDASIDVIEYREGDKVTTPQKIPKPGKNSSGLPMNSFGNWRINTVPWMPSGLTRAGYAPPTARTSAWTRSWAASAKSIPPFSP